ncbi:MAG: (2Fe-2S)-binding protein [Gemmatimonadetes bacterium]|nr:(2Fe-2S)-binding protein [Gemmatimonadota bacterium]
MAETQPLRGPFRVPSAADRPPKQVVRLNVNGHAREVAVRPSDVLLDTLRDDLGLTGTTRGCDMGTCGCCTVHVDGRPVLSCLTLTLLAEGAEIRTIEDVAPAGTDLHPVQRAFAQHGGSQCGFCTPGFIMTSVALLARRPDPSDEEIRREISGNMCRCTGYNKIVESVRVAAAELRGEEVASVASPGDLDVPRGAYDKPAGAYRSNGHGGGKSR